MLTNLKRRTALLLTAAVLCSVTVLAPTTAGAVASKVPNVGTVADPHTAPANLEVMSACPGASAAAAGFTDTTSTDVDCINMFGVTTGATATTYEPAGTIPRWQMALFIHRMFVPTGVAAAGTTTVPAWTDTSGLSTEIQNAINALASHAITLGTTTTTFSPDDLVTREQMALFLNRFASIAKDHAGVAIAASTGDGAYNYTDIANTSFEAMESIIRLYNLGVTDGTCTVDALGVGCVTTYRPSDNITRAEMATMLTGLLNHTNARPAGVSIQASSAGSTLAVGGVDTLISVRNADFSAKSNVLVDEFYQEHNDTAGVAVQVPFHAVLGTCQGTVTKTPGATLCTVDTLDATTGVLGNVAGSTLTTNAYETTNWWVFTGASGTQYVDGTTSDTMKLSISFGAASALVNASTVTVTQGNTNALTTDKSALGGITQTDGINTFAGGSRTFTVTLKPAVVGTTVKSGYSIKVATVTSDNLGNVTMGTAYYPVADAVASWTTTCPADDSALNTNYAVAIQHTITMGALLDADGLPTGVTTDPLDNDGVGDNYGSTTWGAGVGGANSNVGLTCDDEIRVHTPGGAHVETLSISSNNYTLSTAGSLASITATAYDQYGAGIAGVGAQFTSKVTLAAGTSVTGNIASLTTGANGTATLSAVSCATGVRDIEWAITDPGGAFVDAIAKTTPTATSEGTTIYCSSAGTDGLTQQVADVRGTVVFTFDGDIEQIDSAADTNLSLTFNGGTASVMAGTGQAGGVTATTLETAVRALTGVDAATACAYVGGNLVVACTWPANTGPVGTIVASNNTLADDATAVALVITQGGAATSVLGVSPVTFDFVDDDPGNDTLLTVKTVKAANAAGASATTTTYQTWVYDSTDAFALDAADDDVAASVNGATLAQFETENASLTGQATDMTINYRTGALTSGVSYFVTGT